MKKLIILAAISVVMGMTLPMFWFTSKLVKLNDAMKGKEDEANG